jgi:NADPH:quinone reductase-like Zn-dependent oxidoreductase
MLPTVGAVALGALRTGRLAPGQTVLVTAAAGAIGHLAVQLARRQGAGTVIATASPAKLGFLKELGADVAIDHTRPDWAAQVREAAPAGIDLVLEAVGGEVLHQSVGLLAPFGSAVVFGASAGDLTSIPVTSLFGLKTAAGFSLQAWRDANTAQARLDLTELAGLFQAGELRGVTTSLPLADVVQAHQLLEDRAVVGRLILVP